MDEVIRLKKGVRWRGDRRATGVSFPRATTTMVMVVVMGLPGGKHDDVAVRFCVWNPPTQHQHKPDLKTTHRGGGGEGGGVGIDKKW